MFTKHSSKLLAVVLAVLVAGGIIAAKAPTAAKQYDYISLVQEYNLVYITQGAAKFERVKVEIKDRNQDYNLEALFLKVNEFEAQGYELVTSNAFTESPTNIRTYVLMRRPK